MPIGSKQCLVLVCVQVDVFSQTTIHESTVPKRLFFACHCVALSVTGPLLELVIRTSDSEFTNKLERQTHGTELRIRRASPCIVEAASAKADLFFSVRQRESTDKNEAEGEAVVFRHGIITFVALTRLVWIYRLRKLTLVRQSKRQTY